MGNWNNVEKRDVEEFRRRYKRERLEASTKQLDEETQVKTGVIYDYLKLKEMCAIKHIVDYTPEEYAQLRVDFLLAQRKYRLFIMKFMEEVDNRLMEKIRAELKQ